MIKLISALTLIIIIGINPIYSENKVDISSKGAGAKSITAFDRVGERKIGGYFDTEYFYKVMLLGLMLCDKNLFMSNIPLKPEKRRG